MQKALSHLLRSKPTVMVIASTTAPAGPDDAVGRAMRLQQAATSSVSLLPLNLGICYC